MTEGRAFKLSDKIWEIVCSDEWENLNVDELERLLGKVEQFERVVSRFKDKSETFSTVVFDCLAQKSIIVMRQNYLVTGKYYNEAF
jgi:hypothetical protein